MLKKNKFMIVKSALIFSTISGLLTGKMYVFVLVQLSNILKANKMYV